MKKIIYLIIVIAIIFGIYKFTGKPISTEKPTVSDVETQLKDYLLAKNKERCSGEIKLEYLNDIEIGEYGALMSGDENGWPIYAKYEVTCKEGSLVTSDKDLNDSEDKVAVTFARRNRSGKVELFTPKSVSDFQKMLDSRAF